ncbi:MAG: phospholipase [Solirubrobacteraceae bacterium]
MPGSIDDLVHVLRPAAGEPEGALVLLHGRGADEHDLVPLLEALDPERRLTGVTAGGPLRLPPGGRHWYAVRRVGYPDPATFRPTYATLCGWFDALPGAIGVPAARTVVGGFSQGTVMSYALSLGAGRPSPAGVIALSGFLPEVEGFELDLGGHRDVPVAIAHGALDPVIGVRFGRDARDRLAAAGLPVSYRESPVPHAIDPAAIPELERFARDAVATGSSRAAR